MAHRFAELMFTPHVRVFQEKAGSRASYARLDLPTAPGNDRLGEREASFIAARDSFYMASVSETGWPYVQHRGGVPGFLKLLDERTLAFAEYLGNKQFVSLGNIGNDDRVSLFLMDYPNRRRLKVLGHAQVVDRMTNPVLFERFADDASAKVEHAVVIALEGFDWNCPQYITPRFTETELVEVLAPFRARLGELERENASLRSASSKRGSNTTSAR